MTATDMAPPNVNEKPVSHATAETSVAGLLAGILSDAQTLMRQQADMFKAEVREDFQHSKRAAEFGSLGIVCTTVGALGVITALAYLLHEQFQFAMWASWGIVGSLFLIGGIVLGAISYTLLERFNPLPDQTYNALKENLTWQTK